MTKVTDRLLDIRHLDAGYSGVPVVRDLTLHVEAGEVVVLLGPNGAGKTTTLLTSSGLLPVIGGEIDVFGEPVQARPAHRVAREGLAHVLEDRSLFASMTVEENLLVGNGADAASIRRTFEIGRAHV